MNASIRRLPVTVYEGGQFITRETPIVVEEVVRLHLNGRQIAANACTGHSLEEWAVGYLKTSGVIDDIGDVSSLTVSGTDIHVTTTGTGATGPNDYRGSSGLSGLLTDVIEREATDTPRLAPTDILVLMDEFLSETRLHETTRGAHGGALAVRGNIQVVREDIGRHNAVDMVVGHAVRERIDCAKAVLLTTGRISSEIVRKTSRAGIPIILSHSAATSKAIQDARRGGITAVGYIRRKSMTLYTHLERIIR